MSYLSIKTAGKFPLGARTVQAVEVRSSGGRLLLNGYRCPRRGLYFAMDGGQGFGRARFEAEMMRRFPLQASGEAI